MISSLFRPRKDLVPPPSPSPPPPPPPLDLPPSVRIPIKLEHGFNQILIPSIKDGSTKDIIPVTADIYYGNRHLGTRSEIEYMQMGTDKVFDANTKKSIGTVEELKNKLSIDEKQLSKIIKKGGARKSFRKRKKNNSKKNRRKSNRRH